MPGSREIVRARRESWYRERSWTPLWTIGNPRVSAAVLIKGVGMNWWWNTYETRKQAPILDSGLCGTRMSATTPPSCYARFSCPTRDDVRERSHGRLDLRHSTGVLGDKL